MAVTITKGKNNAINKLTADLEQIFNNLNISHKLNFKLFKEILFLSKDYKVFLSVGLEEDIFNDTKILQTIYPIEKYAIRFINFGNVMNLINGFSSMYEFLTDEENNQNYKFINEKSKEKHLAIEPHKNNLFAITQKVPYTESKKDKYENLLFYIYKYIEGYFLKEELLNLVNDNLKFNNIKLKLEKHNYIYIL